MSRTWRNSATWWRTKLSKPADLDLEACLKRAGIDRSEGFGLVCRVLHRYAFDISRVVTALALARHSTDVAEALCVSASSLDGETDRRTFYQMTGMLRPGGGVNVQVNATAEAGAAAKSEAPSAPRGLPNFEEAMKEIGSALRVLRRSGAIGDMPDSADGAQRVIVSP